MLKAFIITLILLLSGLGFVVWRTGYFQPVEISGGSFGPYFMVYQIHQGAYHNMPKTLEKVEDFFKEQDIPCPLSFGRYLHDPALVDEDRLESHGGCLIKEWTQEQMVKIQNSEFKTEELPAKEYVIARFNGSPSIGPFRVYPEVEKFFKKYGYQQNGPVIEVYQTLGPDSVLTQYLFSY